jgi:hypothetical protein
MVIKGVSYDVGRVMAGNWRPDFIPEVVQHELEIIRDDLHCNAVRICGLDINRLVRAAEMALRLGLEVWLSPEMWDRSKVETLAYITKAAAEVEALQVQFPDQLVLLVGSELTLFMQGIVPGRDLTERMRAPAFWENAKAGKHNPPLNAFLAKANEQVRQVFHGKVSYASLIWEAVDCGVFSISWEWTITGRYGSRSDMLRCSSCYLRPASWWLSPSSAAAPTGEPIPARRGWPGTLWTTGPICGWL